MEEMKRILVSDPLSKKGLEILERAKSLKYDLKPGLSPEELKKIIPEYDGIIIRSETKLKGDIIEAGKQLKVIGRAGIGLDNVDLPTATKKGIVVMNTPPGERHRRVPGRGPGVEPLPRGAGEKYHRGDHYE
jgi:D-3-phosphoglycerate dehydrogenase